MSNDEKRPQLKGVKIRSINTVIIITALVICGFFIDSIITVREKYKLLDIASAECLDCRQYAQMAKDGSYYLTEQVSLYVATGDKQYADNYFTEANVTKRRDQATLRLRCMTVISSPYEPILDAMKLSNKLMEREIYAIRLIAEAYGQDITTFDKRVETCILSRDDSLLSSEEKIKLAYKIIFDESYLKWRDDIDSHILSFVNSTYELAESKKAECEAITYREIIKQFIFVTLLFILTLIHSNLITRLVLKPLGSHLRSIREGKSFRLIGSTEFKDLADSYNRIFEVRHEKELMLRHDADHDAMTGLLNRGAFDRISSALVDKNVSIAMLMIDIDSFKSINDKHGHTVGDEAIKSVADILIHNFRPTDIIARIGGDEFGIIMLDVTVESAKNISAKVNSLNEKLKSVAANLPSLNISVGVSFSDEGYSEDLFHRSDIALYHTKHNGKSGCSFYDKSMQSDLDPD